MRRKNAFFGVFHFNFFDLLQNSYAFFVVTLNGLKQALEDFHIE